MKKLLTLAMLTFGIAAFANDGNVTPGTTDKATATNQQEVKKAVVKPLEDKDDKDKEKPKTKAAATTKRAGCSTCTGVDPRFDIGGYFVEFINRNNLKLVKLLTE